MKNNNNDMLRKRRDFFFDRLQKIERIMSTAKILQNDISDLFLENYDISNSENLINFRKYLDLFQADINKDRKNLIKQLDKINKR